MVISISSILTTFAFWIARTGFISKLFGWIGTVGITTLLLYGFWFGGLIKKVVKIIISIFLILVAFAFAYQAGLLPGWLPLIIIW